MLLILYYNLLTFNWQAMDSYLINWSYSGYCFSSTFVRFIDSHWQSALEYCSPWLRTRLKGWQPLDDRDKRPLKTPVRLGSEPWSARRTSSSLKCDYSAREREKKKEKDDRLSSHWRVCRPYFQHVCMGKTFFGFVFLFILSFKREDICGKICMLLYKRKTD